MFLLMVQKKKNICAAVISADTFSSHLIFYAFTFTHLSKATYSAFMLYIYLSVHVFPGNRTHNLCAANAML